MMDLATLQVIWFLLFGVLIIGYAILDGFDLGIGALSLFVRDPRQRGQHMDVIAPVWDGNEVWLLTGGGALFAAFPPVYATVFSGFYIAFMLLLAALIFRAVSFEFRHKIDSPGWRSFWDYAFGLGSLVPALLYGVAVGNVLHGLPVTKDATGFVWQGTFLGLLNPYALLVGVTGLAMFLTHGALYLAFKADGPVAQRAGRWAPRLWIAWVALWALSTMATVLVSSWLLVGLLRNPLFFLLLGLALASLVAIPVWARSGSFGKAFLASSTAIAAQIGLVGLSLFPRLVPSSLDLEGASMTITNASSTQPTLTAMLVIALIGMPLVIGYTFFIYRVFKGRVAPGEFYGNHGVPGGH
jgi:cytochrome d ubiquinol oxidase subunit II